MCACWARESCRRRTIERSFALKYLSSLCQVWCFKLKCAQKQFVGGRLVLHLFNIVARGLNAFQQQRIIKWVISMIFFCCAVCNSDLSLILSLPHSHRFSNSYHSFQIDFFFNIHTKDNLRIYSLDNQKARQPRDRRIGLNVVCAECL